MSETTESLRHKIEGAGELESVVRTMKALAASSIGQYERSVLALGDYYRTIELGLAVSLREEPGAFPKLETTKETVTGAVVFGSDQGLVGQFNDVLSDFVVKNLTDLPGEQKIWAVGDRIYARLKDEGLPVVKMFNVPNSVHTITPLVGQILIESEGAPLYIYHNRPKAGALYDQVSQRLLPVDEKWREEFIDLEWPTENLPEVLGNREKTLSALIREYLFVSLFKACAESLASENASRLAAMQRAEKNISEMLEDLQLSFHRVRQNSIDEELFDVISGFEALGKKK